LIFHDKVFICVVFALKISRVIAKIAINIIQKRSVFNSNFYSNYNCILLVHGPNANPPCERFPATGSVAGTWAWLHTATFVGKEK
jgi:hypothetical protein